MSQVQISFPDGQVKSFPEGTSFLEVARSINTKLAKTSIAAVYNDKCVDLNSSPSQDGKVKFIDGDSHQGLDIIRHSTAHVLAMAVQELWPEAKVTIGPTTKDGFYYDFDFPAEIKLSSKDLQKIESRMRRIIKSRLNVERQEMSREETYKFFQERNEDYKLEIIADIPASETLSVYHMGSWADLCRGPHVPHLGHLKALKLTSLAGAHWRGQESRKMLTRIYGTAWANQEQLDLHLEKQAEAKRRDHRLLGQKLDLFSFHPEAPAHAFLHENGTILKQILTQYARRSNYHYDYHEVNTPLMMNVKLWQQSGHYEHYRENMYFVERDDTQAAIKPMNCPGHCLIYRSKKRSYRDLPLKSAEFGLVHRHERSGVVQGLFRVRSFVQDDAHIYCTVDQLQTQLREVLKQIAEVYRDLGFNSYKVELSTRPDKSIGSDHLWQEAEAALKRALDAEHHDFSINPGDGAFYGPKIDIHLIDALERSWQCGTIQLDFSMPERFNLTYVNQNNSTSTPVMIHRAIFGSLERFMGILIEHYGGRFPVGLAPVQVQIISVHPEQKPYANAIFHDLKQGEIRCKLDTRNEKLSYKIREAQIKQVPYMIVVGAKEAEAKLISPRHRDGEQLEPMDTLSFIKMIRKKSLPFRL